MGRSEHLFPLCKALGCPTLQHSKDQALRILATLVVLTVPSLRAVSGHAERKLLSIWLKTQRYLMVWFWALVVETRPRH